MYGEQYGEYPTSMLGGKGLIRAPQNKGMVKKKIKKKIKKTSANLSHN